MSAHETLSVRLSSDLVESLRGAVAAGEYASLDEAVADAVAGWSRRDEEREEQLAWVRARIQASISDPRPSLSMDEVRAHMEEVFRRAEETQGRDAAA